MSQFFSMVLLVALGGALGGALRMGLSEHLAAGIRLRAQGSLFPWPTTGVNLAGCLLLGGLLGWFKMAPEPGSHLWLFAAVGLAGALTTVSSFALEVVALVRDRRFEVAASYILVSLIGCPLFLVAGLLLMRWWVEPA